VVFFRGGTGRFGGFAALEDVTFDVTAGELDRAARFLGQVDRIAEEIHLNFEVYAEDVRTGVEQDLRSRLGQGRFDVLRAEGRSQTIEDAVGEAPPA